MKILNFVQRPILNPNNQPPSPQSMNSSDTTGNRKSVFMRFPHDEPAPDYEVLEPSQEQGDLTEGTTTGIEKDADPGIEYGESFVNTD